MADLSQANSATQSSPLISLPNEVLRKILTYYYQETTISLSSREHDQHTGRKVYQVDCGIETTCTKLREQSQKVRKIRSPRTMVCPYVFRQFPKLVEGFCASQRQIWLRNSITSIKVNAIDAFTKRYIEASPWLSLVWACPQLAEVEICMLSRSRYSKKSVIERYLPLELDDNKRKLARFALECAAGSLRREYIDETDETIWYNHLDLFRVRAEINDVISLTRFWLTESPRSLRVKASYTMRSAEYQLTPSHSIFGEMTIACESGSSFKDYSDTAASNIDVLATSMTFSIDNIVDLEDLTGGDEPDQHGIILRD